MRALILFTLLLPLAQGQLTTVTGTFSDVLGAVSPKLTGTCSLRPGATLTSSSGWVVPASIPRNVQVTNGLFSAALIPTDLSTPVTYHELRCRFPLQTAEGVNCEGNATLIATGTCLVGPHDWGPVYLSVPSSPSSVNLKDIYVTARPPAPKLVIPLSYLNISGYERGQKYCLKISDSGVLTLTQAGCQ